MTRRSGAGIKVIVTVAIGLFVVYGLYSYHEIHSRLKRSDEKGERLRQQHDSLSAQLQVVYEHKSRLETSLQQEKADHRKSRNDLMSQKTELETRFYNEKQELLNRISSINQEHKMLQSQHEDLQMELSKLQGAHNKLQEDNDVIQSRHNEEYQQLRQEKENELASFKDEVANLQRQNVELQNKLDLLMQSNQYNMNQIEDDQKTIKAMKAELLDLQQKQYAQHQQQQQQQQQQPVYGTHQQENLLRGGQQQQMFQQNQGAFQQGGFNQQRGQPILNNDQQQHVPREGFPVNQQFNQVQQQQPIAQNLNQFNQVPNIPLVQQPGDTNFHQRLHEDNKIVDTQQQPQGLQGFQKHDAEDLNINQYQVNPPDMNAQQGRIGDFRRDGRLEINREKEEEIQPGRLHKDFPVKSVENKADENVMQIGKPRFADGVLPKHNDRSKDHVQALGAGNFGEQIHQIQGPILDQNKAKEVNEEEEEDDQNDGDPQEIDIQGHPQQLRMQQQMEEADRFEAQQPLAPPDDYDGDEVNKDNQMLAPHGRAGENQDDDDGPKNELLQNGQPIEDDGYDNPDHKEADENEYGEGDDVDPAAPAVGRDF